MGCMFCDDDSDYERRTIRRRFAIAIFILAVVFSSTCFGQSESIVSIQNSSGFAYGSAMVIQADPPLAGGKGWKKGIVVTASHVYEAAKAGGIVLKFTNGSTYSGASVRNRINPPI